MSLLKSCTSWLWANVKVSWPLWLALISTGFFGVWTFLLAIEVTLQDATLATRWEHFLNGRPNELGDTLAGFVGSLTLIWVVASVFQQSMELKAQRREFEKMVEAQDAQVKALNAQADLFEDEKRRRDQALNREYVRELLAVLDETLNEGYLPEEGLGVFENEWDTGALLSKSISFHTGASSKPRGLGRLRLASFALCERLLETAVLPTVPYRIAMSVQAKEDLDLVISTVDSISLVAEQLDSIANEQLNYVRFDKLSESFGAVKQLLEGATP